MIRQIINSSFSYLKKRDSLTPYICENHVRHRLENGEQVASRRYRIFASPENTRINIARDCNRPRPCGGHGRSRVIRAERKSISRERSAFNRIKHVSSSCPRVFHLRWQNVERGIRTTFVAPRTHLADSCCANRIWNVHHFSKFMLFLTRHTMLCINISTTLSTRVKVAVNNYRRISSSFLLYPFIFTKHWYFKNDEEYRENHFMREDQIVKSLPRSVRRLIRTRRKYHSKKSSNRTAWSLFAPQLTQFPKSIWSRYLSSIIYLSFSLRLQVSFKCVLCSSYYYFAARTIHSTFENDHFLIDGCKKKRKKRKTPLYIFFFF